MRHGEPKASAAGEAPGFRDPARRRTRWPWIASWACLALALSLSVVAHAQPVFTPPDVLNTNAKTDSLGDYSPEIATDGAGNWVAVWHSFENLGGLAGTDYDIFFATSSDNGANWSAPQVLTSKANSDTGSDSFPSIAVDLSGRWITVWMSTEPTVLVPGAGTDSDIFYSISLTDGATWSAPALLNTNGTSDSGGDVGPRIANEGAGDWLVVWHSNESGVGGAGSDADIFFSVSPDEGVTWGAPGLLNINGATDSGFDHYPQIAYSPGAYVVAWQSVENLFGTAGLDTDIFLSTSIDGGQTWTNVDLLNTNGDSDSATDSWVRLAADGSGTYVAVWNSQEDLGGLAGTDYDIFVAMSQSQGSSWTAPELLNSNAIGDGYIDSNPRVVSDQQGGWLAAWYRQGGPSGTDGDIWGALSGHQGLNWTPATLLNEGGLTDTGQDVAPSIASDGSGQWVAAWQSGENLAGLVGTDNDIFFATSNDIDGDGVPDTADAFPMDPSESVDTDGDGTGNNADPDDDGDGLADGVENNSGVWVHPFDTGTNPLVADTDGDGLLDGVETNSGVWVSSEGTGTHPLVADTDGDGLDDGIETNTGVWASLADRGTHPLVPDTDGDGLDDGLDLAPNDGNDCRSLNPQLKIVWGHDMPFAAARQNAPGIGDHYELVHNEPGLAWASLAETDPSVPASLPDALASGVQALFASAQPVEFPPSKLNQLEVATLDSLDPLPALGSPGSPFLIYLASRPSIEALDPGFGDFDGFAWTGLNRFNSRCDGGMAAVVVDTIPAEANPDYITFVDNLVEHVAHEAGHLLGMRHVLRGGLAACVAETHTGDPAVMDYYADGSNTVLGQCGGFGNPGCPITEPPDCSGQETGDYHNPLYYYLHYVLGDAEGDLIFFGDITPGSWDEEGEPLVEWRVEFNFACAVCNLLPLYNITIVEVLPGGGEVVRQTYEVLTIEELNALTIQLPESSGLKLYASTTDPATLLPGETPPVNVVLETPLYPPPDPAAPVTIVSTLLEVEETSPGVYTTATLAIDSNVAVTPIYEIHPTGTYDISDPNIPGGALVSTSTHVPPLTVVAATVSVPEPGFGAGIASGLMGLLAANRIRRRNNRLLTCSQSIVRARVIPWLCAQELHPTKGGHKIREGSR